MEILQNIWTLMLSMYVCADIVSRKTNSELFLTIHVCLPNHFTFIRQNKQKQNISSPIEKKIWVSKKKPTKFLYKILLNVKYLKFYLNICKIWYIFFLLFSESIVEFDPRVKEGSKIYNTLPRSWRTQNLQTNCKEVFDLGEYVEFFHILLKLC